MSEVLVACLGNDLVADDGVGPTVWKSLREQTLPETVRLELFAGGGLELVEQLRGEKLLVVIDAVKLGGDPGQVLVRRWHDLPQAEGRPVTAHDIGLREVLEITSELYPARLPRQAVLVGVEGVCFDQVGVGLSDVVRAALPKVLRIVRRYVDSRVGFSGLPLTIPEPG